MGSIFTRRILAEQLQRHGRGDLNAEALRAWAASQLADTELRFDDLVDGESLAKTVLEAVAAGRALPSGEALTALIAVVNSPTCQHYSAMTQLADWLGE